MRIARMYNQFKILDLLIMLALLLSISSCGSSSNNHTAEEFDGQRAYRDIKYQLELGPRTLNSEAHKKAVEWIVSEMEIAGWEVEIQEGVISGIPVKNIISKRGINGPWVILGSHYDSRPCAD